MFFLLLTKQVIKFSLLIVTFKFIYKTILPTLSLKYTVNFPNHAVNVMTLFNYLKLKNRPMID